MRHVRANVDTNCSPKPCSAEFFSDGVSHTESHGNVANGASDTFSNTATCLCRDCFHLPSRALGDDKFSDERPINGSHLSFVPAHCISHLRLLRRQPTKRGRNGC